MEYLFDVYQGHWLLLAVAYGDGDDSQSLHYSSCAFSVILMNDYAKFLDYTKKHAKKTNREELVKKYY